MRFMLILMAFCGVALGVSLGWSTWTERKRIAKEYDEMHFDLNFNPKFITPEMLKIQAEMNRKTPEEQAETIQRRQPHGTAMLAASALIIVSSITLGAFAAKSTK